MIRATIASLLFICTSAFAQPLPQYITVNPDPPRHGQDMEVTYTPTPDHPPFVDLKVTWTPSGEWEIVRVHLAGGPVTVVLPIPPGATAVEIVDLSGWSAAYASSILDSVMMDTLSREVHAKTARLLPRLLCRRAAQVLFCNRRWFLSGKE